MEQHALLPKGFRAEGPRCGLPSEPGAGQRVEGRLHPAGPLRQPQAAAPRHDEESSAHCIHQELNRDSYPVQSSDINLNF